MDALPEWLAEAIVVIVSVGSMFVFLYLIGTREAVDGQLSATGGGLVIVSLVLFVLILAGVGIVLTFLDPEFSGE